MRSRAPLHEPPTDPHALELSVFWRGALLTVEHVSGERSFTVGDAGSDFVLPTGDSGEQLEARADGTLSLPSSADATSLTPGSPFARPAMRAADGGYALADDETLTLRWCGMTLVLRRVLRAEATPRAPAVRLRDHAWIGGSLLAHSALLLLFSLTPPSASALSVDRLHTGSRLTEFIQLQNSMELEEPPVFDAGDGKAGERAAGDEGQAGDVKAPKVQRRAANRGPRDNPTPAIALGDVREHLDEYSIIGVLRGMAKTEGSSFGLAQAQGSDAETAMGALFGRTIGSSYGIGGLGMLGTGRGGGGDAYGTRGLDVLGTVGNMGHGNDYGDARRMPMRKHVGRVPRIRVLPADVRGSLAREVIRRVIHRNLARVRHCYEQQLVSRPDLSGRVAIKFIIDPSGVVRAATVANSTLGNPRAEQCIAHVVQQLDFPAPEGGGMVVVTYPFVLSQAGT